MDAADEASGGWVRVQKAVIIEAELYHSIAVSFNSPNRDAAFRPLDRAAVLADMVQAQKATPSRRPANTRQTTAPAVLSNAC